MNTPNQASLVERSPLLRLAHWLIQPRTLGRLSCAVLTLVTLVAIFYAEERWRGHRAWENYKAQLGAKAVELNYDTFIPPTVPDDQNFAQTPFLAPLFDFLPGTQTCRDPNAQRRVQERIQSLADLARKRGFELDKCPNGRWELGEPFSLRALLGTNGASQDSALPPTPAARPATEEQAATVVLDLFEQTLGPVFAELRAASQRPACRFNVKYDFAPLVGILLPHLTAVKGLVQRLAWRADAELVLGRTNQAAEDLLLGYYLADTVKAEPILISHLVRLACHAIQTRVLYDGLAGHRWSDNQLQRFQAVLEKNDLLNDTARALRGERAGFGVRLIEQVITRAAGFQVDDLMENGEKARGHVLGGVMPTGWLYLEMLNLCRAHDRFQTPFLAWQNGQLEISGFMQKLAETETEVSALRPMPALLQHRLLSCLLLPALGKVWPRGLQAQVRNDLARTACALERYYLAHGSYPESLPALSPQFAPKVPLDLMSGRPLVYRRANPHSFVLYSLGGNLADDGGKTVLQHGGASTTQGDWVWSQPGK